jgi:hypothetical protein
LKLVVKLNLLRLLEYEAEYEAGVFEDIIVEGYQLQLSGKWNLS